MSNQRTSTSSSSSSRKQWETDNNLPLHGWTKKQNDDFVAAWEVEEQKHESWEGQDQRTNYNQQDHRTNYNQQDYRTNYNQQDYRTNYNQPPPGWTKEQNFNCFAAWGKLN